MLRPNVGLQIGGWQPGDGGFVYNENGRAERSDCGRSARRVVRLTEKKKTTGITGFVDDVRIFDTILTASQVRASEERNDCVCCWPLTSPRKFKSVYFGANADATPPSVRTSCRFLTRADAFYK